ncbi:Cofilin/tropomyosin-type actin-binding protein [Dictyocaulus viviparus]|uniref:Cofilin/tropomyosin-type actin-binding protein n=1 Tax=Dictyocaulus viviparus TaxID=29172 RepID=A0A0D8Y9U6_DICVI|nr:Cofilin/tropomyosin-type actin-binding protein [Dictyocaulus viviparus]
MVCLKRFQSTSGVMVNPDVQATFQKLSEGKKEFRYIIFKIEEREVVVEAAVTQEELGLTGDDYDDSSKAAFEKFVADIKARTDGFTDCRYAVFDFKFTCSRVGAGTSKMDKIVFLQLCPDGASIKKKMVYASSASAIKASLGTGKILQFQVCVGRVGNVTQRIAVKADRKIRGQLSFSGGLDVFDPPVSETRIIRECVLRVALCITTTVLYASGVKIDPSCKNAYDMLHNKHQHSYIIFKIDKNDTAIVVEKVGDKGAPYSEFIEEMKKAVDGGKECRYAAVDVEVQVQRQGTEGGSKLNKVIFVQYCPDQAPVRRRMLYASSVRALKATLGLESLMQVQASDLSDLDEKAIKHDLVSSQRT